MSPDALASLHALCFEVPRPWAADEFASLLASKGVFLHSSDAGFALGRYIAGEVELLTLAVDPACRRQGHGRILLSGYEAEAIRRGATESFLEVSQVNAAARSLYHTAGYTESGRRPAYYTPPTGPKVAAIVMRKPLI